MTDNTKIWDDAKKVPLSATKENSSGGYKATSIQGYWFYQKATEIWGPCGTGWGYDILEDVFTDGVPLTLPDSGMPVCNSQMHTIKVALWYEGCKEKIIQIGHTPYIYMTKNGPYCDMEAPKKSLTDAIKKALSMVGFAAEVYLGEFDDRELMQVKKLEEDIQSADDKEAMIVEKQKELEDYVIAHIGLVKTAVTEHEINRLVLVGTAHLHRRKDIKELTARCVAGQKAITVAGISAKEKLTENQENE